LAAVVGSLGQTKGETLSDRYDKHQDILERITKILTGMDELSNVILVSSNINDIKTEEKFIMDTFNQGLRAIRNSNFVMSWDGVIVGSLDFVAAVLRAAREQLEETMEEAAGEEEEAEKETIH
jgi:hypothetical protein